MTVMYTSTRTSTHTASFKDVLMRGMAPDGGLYVPKSIPEIDIKALAGQDYITTAHAVMSAFTGDAIDLKPLIAQAYQGDVFRHHSIAPLVQIGPDHWLMELFHGPTFAFKDVALQMLGRLFDHILEQQGERVTIVGATSGDTGSAAIEACRHCKYIDIFILHPKGRVSEIQRRQMTTIDAPNVHNIAVDGNFDDCQALVKALFADDPFRSDVRLSAVNSINWARVMAQTVYYVSAAVALGKKVNFAVPTGNFGNIYAGYIAKHMGAEIGKLIIGTNRNDILTRFFESGEMALTEAHPSYSPSMDIQISSNFERYLWHLHEGNSAEVCQFMQEFKASGRFQISKPSLAYAYKDFEAYRCDDPRTLDTIKDVYHDTGQVIDPHTAVGVYAARRAKERGLEGPIISLACAHPAKFGDAVTKALGFNPALPPQLESLKDRPEQCHTLPNDLKQLQHYIKQKI